MERLLFIVADARRARAIEIVLRHAINPGCVIAGLDPAIRLRKKSCVSRTRCSAERCTAEPGSLRATVLGTIPVLRRITP